MSFMKKAAAAAVLAMGLSAGAQAAMQTFVFEGQVALPDQEMAQFFGVADGLTADFTATLRLDTGLTTDDAYFFQHWDEYTDYRDGVEYRRTAWDEVIYIAEAWSVTVGDYSYEAHGIGRGGAFLDLAYAYDPTAEGAYNYLDITQWGGVVTEDARYLSFDVRTFAHASQFQLDNANADQIYKFNGLAEHGALDWGVKLYDPATGITKNAPILNITMSLAPAVPEPATWLTLILGFGLAGVAVRRRRVVLAA